MDLLEKFTLNWFCSLDDQKTWLPCGTSENRLYITMAMPLKTEELYESVLYIGCMYGKGKVEEAGVFEGIWQHFATRKVKNVKGKELSYYGDPFTAVTETKALLDKRVGQCGSFAKLFLDVLYAQGINTHVGKGNYVTFCTIGQTPSNFDYGFLVKKWSFSGNGSSGDAEFSFQNIPNGMIGNEYAWLGTPEVTDLPGVPGQNNPNPNSIFSNHQLVFYKDKFYDPSYGTTFNSETKLSETAIEGFYKTVKVDKSEMDLGVNMDEDPALSSVKKKIDSYYIKENPKGLQIEILYSYY